MTSHGSGNPTTEETMTATPERPNVQIATPSLMAAADTSPQVAGAPIMDMSGVSVFYGDYEAVRDTTMPIRQNQITAMIGPSGCGKSTILRSLNRMNDLIPGARVAGKVSYHGHD